MRFNFFKKLLKVGEDHNDIFVTLQTIDGFDSVLAELKSAFLSH